LDNIISINAIIERTNPIKKPIENIPRKVHITVAFMWRRLKENTNPINEKPEKTIIVIITPVLLIISVKKFKSNPATTRFSLEVRNTAVKIPRTHEVSNKNEAIIGLVVCGFSDDRIVFLGSPCSSQPHSIDFDLSIFLQFIVNE